MFKRFIAAIAALTLGVVLPACGQQQTYKRPCCTIKQTIKVNDTTNTVYGRTRIDSIWTKKGQAPKGWGLFVLDSLVGPTLYRWHDTTVYDTTKVMVIEKVFDTTFVTVADTVPVFDTTFVTVTDTLYDTLSVALPQGADTVFFGRDSLRITWWHSEVVKRVDSTKVLRLSGGGTPSVGVPYGWFNAQPFTLGFTAGEWVAPRDPVSRLESAKQAGAKVFVNVVGGGACAKDTTGTFRMELWKACFAKHANAQRTAITTYSANGTILLLYLIDEPNHPTRWGPAGTITPAMVEEMAVYAKSFFPLIDVYVRAAPEWLASGRPVAGYQALTGAWAQYAYVRGPLADYRNRMLLGAQQLGLKLVFSLNAYNGGNTVGVGDRGDEMSPAQLVEASSAFLGYGCAFVMWEWRPGYSDRPDIVAATTQVQAMARTRTTPLGC